MRREAGGHRVLQKENDDVSYHIEKIPLQMERERGDARRRYSTRRGRVGSSRLEEEVEAAPVRHCGEVRRGGTATTTAVRRRC